MVLMSEVEAKLAEHVSPQESIPGGSLWIKIVSLGVLISFLYFEILGRLASDWWTDPNFSHGFLVPVFSVLVAWQSRKRMATQAIKPSWIGLLLIAGSLMVLI